MAAHRSAAREHALQYDADKILTEYWEPFLDGLEASLRRGRRKQARTPKPKVRTVWSPVMFRDELDMLEMRLHETDGLIDRHVIVEADVTHRGVPKPLYFRDSQGPVRSARQPDRRRRPGPGPGRGAVGERARSARRGVAAHRRRGRR